ncbi:ESCRT-I complex subunit VPS37, partial [Tremellales sp. Uapishka_1]
MSTPLLQTFPSLATYPPAFLKDLLSSPELLEAFLFSLPEVQDLTIEVEKLGIETEELARKNLELRDQLIALREATAQSWSHAEELKKRWAELEKQQSNLYQRQRPSFLHLRLRHSLTNQDGTTESLASGFIDGPKSGVVSRVDSPALNETSNTSSGVDRSQNKAIDDFIQQFKAERKVYHKRAIWTERWSRGEVAWRDD